MYFLFQKFNTVGERIRALRENRTPPLSVRELAQRAGLAISTIYDLENGRSQTTTKLHRIADVLAVSAEWLESGKGEIREPHKIYGEGIQPGPHIEGRVPLISWVQAGEWSDIIDNFQPGDAEDWLMCPQSHSSKTYCLRVKGESMYNPGGRYSYANGDIIFVDPERAAYHGDRVIVRLDDKRETTFKQLIEESGARFLKALNPNWKPQFFEIDDTATICGVIIGTWRPE